MYYYRRLLRHQRYLLLLVISSLLAPLIINLGSAWLQEKYKQAPGQLLYLAVYVVVIIVFLLLLYFFIGKEKPRELTTKEMRPPHMPGLIVIVGTGRKDTSPEQLSHNHAIEYHLQGHANQLACWLIATEGLHGSLAAANDVLEYFKPRCRVIQIRGVKDAFDVQETYRIVRDIYEQEAQPQGLRPEQIIADFTGGTKPMSAGIILACGDRWPMQYMFGRPGVVVTTPVSVKFNPLAPP